MDWINQRSFEALGTFVLWSLDSILADMAAQQSGTKVSKKGVNAASSKSQVSLQIFFIANTTMNHLFKNQLIGSVSLLFCINHQICLAQFLLLLHGFPFLVHCKLLIFLPFVHLYMHV